MARCSDSAGWERVAAMVELIRGVGGPELQRAEEAFAEYEATFPQESADASGDDAAAGGEAGGEENEEAGAETGGEPGEEAGGDAGEEAGVEAGGEAGGEAGEEAGGEAGGEAGEEDSSASSTSSSSGEGAEAGPAGGQAAAKATARAKAKAASRGDRWKFQATGLTYNHTEDDWASTDSAVLERLFTRFVTFLRALGEELQAKGLTAKMERAPLWSGADAAHVHLHGYLHLKAPFEREGPRALECFAFVDGEKTHRPHLEKNTASGRNYKGAVRHGHFYLAVDKIGSLFMWTNYPPWRAYAVEGWWLDNWLKEGKLTREVYLKTAARVTVGFQRRLTDVRAAERYEMELAAKELASEEGRKVAPLRKAIVQFPEVARFLDLFGPGGKERRPMLVIVGETGLGKSLLGAAVLENVALKLGLEGYLEVTVENSGALDLSDLDVRRHSGVLLDGVGDALLLKENREALQGRPKVTKGGRSATMMYAYLYTLARRAVVVTLDLSAQNLGALQKDHPVAGTADHWLTDERNVIVLWLNGRQTWCERPPLSPPRPLPLGQRRRVG